MAFETTMKDLLTNVKQVFVANRTTLGVTQFKRGVLSVQPVFPAIACLPQSETILEYRNNGKYVIQRDISVEVYARNYDAKKANEKVKEIISKIVDICQTQNRTATNRWSQSAFDSIWGEEAYEQPFEDSNQVMQIGVLPMTFISNESMPSRTATAEIVETDYTDILDSIYNKCVTYQNGSDATFDLTNVQTMYTKEIPPIAKFPSIAINGRRTSRDRKYRGEDEAGFGIEFAIWNKLLDKEYTLNANLDIVEVMKDVIQKNYQWSGKVQDTIINNINYERVDSNTLGFMYKTTIDTTVLGIERFN